jgi:RimJ/RimL family protein N-acetyltransferase
MRLRLAGLDDIAFIMATERRPGYEGRVGRWTEAEHRTGLAASGTAYLIGETEAGEAAAFAIIQSIGDAHGNLYLKRIAVAQPGAGTGARFLIAITDWAFRETEAYRFWLEVFADNARARHVYRRCGFTEEGTARAANRRADGDRVDLVVMSVLKPEWNDRTDDPVK